MSIEETVKVDSKGRVTIPSAIRELFDIREGMYLLMVADKNSKEIKLVPIPITAQLIKLRLIVEDRMGVLADITKFLASKNVDIISSKCIVLKREELGECEMIIDISRSNYADPSLVEEDLRRLEPVKNVEVFKLM